MSIDNVVLWYERNVNYKLTKAFLTFLVKIGLIKNEIDLEILNLYLLDKDGDEFIIENGKYKLKENRIPIINNYKDEELVVNKEEKTKKKEEKKEIVTLTHKTNNNSSSKKTNRKFKIETLGGKKLKLVKI